MSRSCLKCKRVKIIVKVIGRSKLKLERIGIFLLVLVENWLKWVEVG